MFRIGVMTFLHNENYGSALQAWALQQTLLQMGYDAWAIDYRPSAREKALNLLASGNSPALLLDGIRKRKVKRGQAGARDKAAGFAAFQKNHLRLTAPCADTAALRAAGQSFHGLICGSDQIWSPLWLNPAYFLNFAESWQPKLAYAASLGVSEIPSKAKYQKIRRLASDFSAISIREQEGATLISSMTGREVPVMPDPVCLLKKSAWLALADSSAVPQTPYLLCYFLGDRPDYWQTVETLRKRSGWPVVVIPVTENSYRQPYQLAAGLSPEAWLGLLSGAARVVTDSFHGALLSAVLGRPFTVLRRDRDGRPGSRNSRIDQLLRALGLTGQKEEIPFDQVEVRLSALRETGLTWLAKSLAEAGLASQAEAARKDESAPPYADA